MHAHYIFASKYFGRFIIRILPYCIYNKFCAELRWVCSMLYAWILISSRESTHSVTYSHGDMDYMYREKLECCVQYIYCSTYIYSCVPWRQREMCLLVYIYARFPWVLRSASFWLLLLLLFNFWLHCAESLEGNSMCCEAAPDIYLWHPERQHRSWCRRYIFTCLSTLHMMQAALAYSAHVLTCDWMTQVLPTVDGGITYIYVHISMLIHSHKSR